jgi:hypothetical protein
MTVFFRNLLISTKTKMPTIIYNKSVKDFQQPLCRTNEVSLFIFPGFFMKKEVIIIF